MDGMFRAFWTLNLDVEKSIPEQERDRNILRPALAVVKTQGTVEAIEVRDCCVATAL
jgi:hypothetical protein